MRLPLCECAWFLSSSLPNVRLNVFYYWHHVMLVMLEDDNTTGSLWLCLLYIFRMFYESIYICLYIQSWYVQMTRLFVCVYVCYCLLVIQYTIGLMLIILLCINVDTVQVWMYLPSDMWNYITTVIMCHIHQPNTEMEDKNLQIIPKKTARYTDQASTIYL